MGGVLLRPHAGLELTSLRPRPAPRSREMPHRQRPLGAPSLFLSP